MIRLLLSISLIILTSSSSSARLDPGEFGGGGYYIPPFSQGKDWFIPTSDPEPQEEAPSSELTNSFPNIPMEPPGEGELVHFNSVVWPVGPGSYTNIYFVFSMMFPGTGIYFSWANFYPEDLESDLWQSIISEATSYERDVLGIGSSSSIPEQIKATAGAVNTIFVYNPEVADVFHKASEEGEEPTPQAIVVVRQLDFYSFF